MSALPALSVANKMKWTVPEMAFLASQEEILLWQLIVEAKITATKFYVCSYFFHCDAKIGVASGPNLTTSEFTTMHNASDVAG
jgi:hypothetical protein